MKFKYSIIFLIIISAFLTLGAASAQENISSTHPQFLGVEETPVDLESEDVTSPEENDDYLSMGGDDVLTDNVGTLTDLQNYINNAPSGASIELTQNYKFDENDEVLKDPYTYDIGVDARRIVSIDGKGHYIDGGNIAKGFARANLDSFTLKNIVFMNCGSPLKDSNGGVAYTYYLTVENCTFINCSGNSGGAFYVGYEGIFRNCDFINCSGYTGGAIYADGVVKIYNSKFYNNSAFYAGSLWLSGSKYIVSNGFVSNTHHIEDSEFIDNSAYYCGVIGITSQLSSQADPILLKNNKFIRNNASGGSVILTSNNIESIDNTFEGNQAIFSTIIAQNFTSTNDKFINNKAGSIVVGTFYGGSFKNTKFENNIADDGVLMAVTEDVSLPGGIDEKSVIYTDPSMYRLGESDFTYGYCIEKLAYKPTMKGRLLAMPNIEYNVGDGSEDDYLPYFEIRNIDYLYYSNDIYNMSIVKNHLDFSDVSDYLKLLIYNYYPLDGTKFKLYDVVWIFTDEDYRKSNNTIVQDVLKRYDDGERVSDYAIRELDDGSFVTYKFMAVLSQTTYQNLFIFKLENSSMDVSKKSLNSTVNIGEIASFNISITNDGLVNLTDVFVVENIPEGLEYVSFTGDGWSKIGNKFLYDGIFKINETIGFIINFKTTKIGSLLNNVIVGSYQTGNKTSNDTVDVLFANFTVEKISLNPKVGIGETSSFDIVIKNTGLLDLTGIFVSEVIPEGLTYLSHSNTDEWVKNGDVFNYLKSLGVDETIKFTINFNTTKIGNWTNTVIAGSNQTDNKTAENTTEVVNKTVNETIYPGDEPYNFTDTALGPPSYEVPTKEVTSKEVQAKTVQAKVDEKATGNPILLALMVVLIALNTLRRRRD